MHARSLLLCEHGPILDGRHRESCSATPCGTHDAEEKGINEGDWVGITSRAGDTVLRAEITERVQPGVVYTTFHHPVSGANVITA